MFADVLGFIFFYENLNTNCDRSIYHLGKVEEAVLGNEIWSRVSFTSIHLPQIYNAEVSRWRSTDNEDL